MLWLQVNFNIIFNNVLSVFQINTFSSFWIPGNLDNDFSLGSFFPVKSISHGAGDAVNVNIILNKLISVFETNQFSSFWIPKSFGNDFSPDSFFPGKSFIPEAGGAVAGK